MSDGSSTWLSQDLSYAQAKISTIGTNLIDIININILKTEKAITLCRSAKAGY